MSVLSRGDLCYDLYIYWMILKVNTLLLGVTTKVHKPVAFTASSVHNSGPSNKDSHKISSEIQHSVSMSATEGEL